jgi:hypothetical protein
MDRYTQFGLRGDADEQIRRAVRDGFKRAGLSHAQLTQAMEVMSHSPRPPRGEAAYWGAPAAQCQQPSRLSTPTSRGVRC